MTFRKTAIATLKAFREQGLELQVKLNATNQGLYDELVRIEAMLGKEGARVQHELSVLKYKASQAETAETKQDQGEQTVLECQDTDIDTQRGNELKGLFDKADDIMSKPIYKGNDDTNADTDTDEVMSFDEFCDSIESTNKESVTPSQLRIEARRVATENLLNHLKVLVSLVVLLANTAIEGSQRDVKTWMMEHTPNLLEACLWLLEKGKTVRVADVMDKVFCLS